MLDISRRNLESDLIEASMQAPVLLDIWAPWCGPCKSLGPLLERLETAYAGRFTLAKLNSDDEPEVAGQLSQMFGVRSIPFCVLFKQGQPVDGFVGALPEAEIRAFLDKHVEPAAEAPVADEIEADADALDDPAAALDKLRQAVAAKPKDDTARYEFLRALLREGRIDEARAAYAAVAGQPLLDARLVACGLWIDACDRAVTAGPVDALQARVAADKRDFDARYLLAQTHFAAQRQTAALDELLEIVMRDKSWNKELARKTYVAILELMTQPKPAAAASAATKGALELPGKLAAAPSDPVLDAYRRKLSMALF
jgi:putative thioredoxin